MLMKWIQYLLSMLCAIAFSACKPAPYLSVSPDSIAFGAEGGAKTVKVSANSGWTASVSGPGFSVKPSSGEGEVIVTIVADEATSQDPASGTVTFKSGGLTASVRLTQDPKILPPPEEKVLVVGEVASVNFNGATVTVRVQYNVDYSVEVEESAQSWISVIRTKATLDGQIELKVSANPGEQRTGNVTVRESSGEIAPITVTIVQDSNPEIVIRRALMAFYDAMDGPNWTDNAGWGTDLPVSQWAGVRSFYASTGSFSLSFNGVGLKGQIPDGFCDLGPYLQALSLQNEPGITGTIPASFSKFSNLVRLSITDTSLSSLRDCFSGMKSLNYLSVMNNSMMTGPLPASLAECPDIKTVTIVNNGIDGEIPASWARLGNGSILNLQSFDINNNYLYGKIPQFIFDAAATDLKWLFRCLYQKGVGLDISETDIPAYGDHCVKGQVKDINGSVFTFDDVIKSNQYTVNLIWASWCPNSRKLMSAVKAFYERYHRNGLEIIATSQVGGVDENGTGHILDDFEGYKNEIIEKGYDQWYNYYWPDYGNSYLMSTPNAEVYDKNGNVVFSSISSYSDPDRNRFGKIATTDLIPFLESLFGPANPDELYYSSDFSMDGDIITLQKATAGKGINIVFLGDAYTDKDMAPGGLYETVMKQAMEAFFSVEPYKSFRDRFSVYAVKVVSLNDRIGGGSQTALGTFFGSGSYVNGDNDKCFEYALKVPGINSRDNLLVSVLVNSLHASGTTILYDSDQSAIARVSTTGNDSYYFGETLQHEAGGHGFAFLADEYTDYSQTAPSYLMDDYNSMYDRYGWFSNVDFTSDPSKIRWSEFLSDSRYQQEVGIYEGAALYEKGAWRPSVNSIMKDNYGGFNAPSRWAIYQQIMKRSGEEARLQQFIEYDSVNRGNKLAPSARPAAHSPLAHGTPPVILP